MLRRFLPSFRNIPIKGKLISTFAVFFFVPFLLSSMFFYITSTRDITRREYDRSIETLKLFQNSVEAQLKNNEKRSEDIYASPRIFAPFALRIPPRLDEFELFHLQQALQSFRTGQTYIESVYLFLPNGQYAFADTGGGGRYATIFQAHPEWNRAVEAADGRAYWIASVVIPSLHDLDPPSHCVSFGRVLKNIYSSNFFPMGVLVVNLKTTLFDEMGKSSELSGSRLVMVTDRDDDLVWSANRSWYEKEVAGSGLLPRLRSRGADVLRRERIAGGTYFAAYLTSDYNSWHYIALIPESAILRQAQALRNYFGAILLLCLLLSFLGAAVIGRYVTTPIARLIVSMNRVGKDADPPRRRPESLDEIGFLHKGFNDMSERIQNLIAQAKDAQRREKEHELRALQAQINPHFLANTLDTINWMARERGERAISRMLTSLSRILQYSIENGRPVLWRDEIQWLKNYVYLHQVRYEDRLVVRYDIDEAINDLPAFHLLLQPFVENAIRHGLRDGNDRGEILVSGRLEDDCVVVEIADNGCGMTEAQINEIFSGVSDGMGIFNVHQRIRLKFGPPYGVTMEPRVPRGTRVIVRFPAHG
jgi:sensor histidine kinase YesM